MVTRTIKLKEIFRVSPQPVIDIIGLSPDGLVRFSYTPDPETIIKLKMDKTSSDALKAKYAELIALLEAEITVTATVERKQISVSVPTTTQIWQDAPTT